MSEKFKVTLDELFVYNVAKTIQKGNALEASATPSPAPAAA